ncbi:MAG TPA: MazG nucleotide pyrophosphohydrolase domain-containing protein [Anaerolineales bacterium]|nr:MazG nucleotide pyrophosphohydrolase domain-containing protein [Anaerolineales bacterium]
MEFQQLMKRALEIRKQFEAKEREQFGSAWNSEEIALGFVGDVGDLAKLTIAVNGKRNIPNSKEKLEHELADCLWSVIVLSHIHGIDLENSFVNTMNELEKYLSENSL